jgi:hypothetical protein
VSGWWRSWHGAATDAKWGVVAAAVGCKAAEVAAFVWALLDHASQGDPRGSIAGFNLRVYAFASGTAAETALRILDELRAGDIGVLDGEAFTNWAKRQPRREDDSTERVRRHRNGVKRDVTQRNAPDTESDTDTEIPEAVASDAPAEAAAPSPAAAPGPIDLKAAIFGSGVPLLTRSGLTDPNARSFIGRMRKSFGDGAVLEVLAAAQAEGPSDVVAWMSAALEDRYGRKRGRTSGWRDA